MTRPRPMLERFEALIASRDGCWIWGGRLHVGGYGFFSTWVNGKWTKLYAHRVAFELYHRPLVEGETVDHLCFNRACVNPEHLDACSVGENTRRSPRTITGRNIRKTHCPQGHPYSGENLFYDRGSRRCRICTRAKCRRQYAQKRVAA